MRRFTCALILLLVATSHKAPAQTIFDSIDQCDVMAAHPADVERLADGVANDAIIPKLAIAACEAAIQAQSKEPRFQFQLGRAYAAANRHSDAAAQFQKAADQGYAAALAYLGDAYASGSGVAASPEKALSYFKQASAKGFTPADAQIAMLTFDPSMYVLPMLAFVYANRDPFGGENPAGAQAYLFSFVMVANNECDGFLPPRTIGLLYRRRYPPDRQVEDESVNTAVQSAVAEYDAHTFLKRHGCEGPVTTRIKDNLNHIYQSAP